MVPKNLQEHMLRTAALAEIILENWTGKELDNNSIVQTCAFHDIAKPMTFDLAKQADFGMSEEDIKKLGELQVRIKKDFSSDEHTATVKICEKIGLSETSVKLAENLEWEYIPRLLKVNDIESLIPIYCDMRIGLKGILTLDERLEDLKERTNADEYEENVKNGKALEELIKNNTEIDVDSITDEQINERFEKLLNIEI